MFFLLDDAASIRHIGSDTAVRFLRLTQTHHDIHAVEYRTFVSQHPEFLLARTRPEGWILQALIADGADIRLLRQDKDPGYFVEDTLLFHVRMDAGAGRPTESSHPNR
jgi:hypothetical protein